MIELRDCLLECGFSGGLQYELASALDSLDYTIAMDAFHRYTVVSEILLLKQMSS